MQSPETAMTYDMQSTPKDVVPPGCQTGTYYIPISNVCETLPERRESL